MMKATTKIPLIAIRWINLPILDQVDSNHLWQHFSRSVFFFLPYGEGVDGGSEAGEEVDEDGAGGREESLHGDGEEDEGEGDPQDGVHDREQLPRVGQRRHVAVA